ncbi:hypothetical protein HDV63DRAFT_384998 [Trichoderma sp. SZMC 28014]
MDESGRAQSVDGLSLDINIDTLTANKAMFKLSCSIFLKMKDNNKLSIHLFILPPSIRSIELKTKGGYMSLHFYMDQNAILVVPGDDPLEPKARSKQLLNSIKALSLVKNFTIQLGNTDISESIKSSLDHAASIFSPNNQWRPGTNEEMADIKSLYGGKGGEIFNAAAATAGISKEASVPLPYPSNKRKRKREQFVSDEVIHDSRKDLETRLARMEACLAETQSRLAKTEARLAELETSLEESEEEGTDRGSYGEEEVAAQVSELLDDFIYSHALENMVEDLVGKYMGHLNVDVDEMFAEKENRFDETIEEVKQDVMEDCRETVLEQVKRHLAELIDTRLEISFGKKES